MSILMPVFPGLNAKKEPDQSHAKVGSVPRNGERMENLKKLPDQALLDKVSALVKVERETTTEILHHLREVERRRLYAQRGFSSLFSYCVESLGYSESSAQRRISSMRLLKSLEPEVAKAVERKSARAATRELQNLSSQEIPPVREYSRPASHGRTEIHLVVDEATLETLKKIKGLLSHSDPNIGWGALVERITQIAWQKLDPTREPVRKKKNNISEQDAKTEEGSETNIQSDVGATEQGATEQGATEQGATEQGATEQGATEQGATEQASTKLKAMPTSAGKRERIPVALKRKIWRNSNGRCSYVDSVTGKYCGSTRFLQIEHLLPVAFGGKNDLSNCTLKCFSHNQLSAIQIFGRNAIERYVPSLE